jgi:hypothetical protein
MEDYKNFNQGINQDISPSEQPDGTYRFALNAINESLSGDEFILGNELGNISVRSLPGNFTIVGKTYMYDNKICLILAHLDQNITEIGIFDTTTQIYTTHVNDTTSLPVYKLNVRPWHQIEVIYRLRQGCNHTIYFFEKDTKPRYFDFNNPNNFKNQDDTWNKNLFSLQNHYNSIPFFQNLEVLDSGGNLLAGSINIAIQYLDSNFNPTEWVTSSPLVNIYHDSIENSYNQIDGSTNLEQEQLNLGPTSKSLKTEINNLDLNYAYYKLAFIERNDVSGKVSRVIFSNPIDISNNIFIYTGENGGSIGTEEEILFFTDIIEGAKNVNQIDNQLVIANLKGNKTNFCLLQKYASQINADCVTKEVNLTNNKHPLNPKNPVFSFNNGVGYMPGEMYSFGIVYIFEDNTLSPVCHIPGKNSNYGQDFIFTTTVPSTTVHPMRIDNEIFSVYTENNVCDNQTYWGLDSYGEPLVNKNVRHHRFPYRTDINKPLVNVNTTTNQVFTFQKVVLTLTGNLIIPVPCASPGCGSDVSYVFEIKLNYTHNGENYSINRTINTAAFADGINNNIDIEISTEGILHETGTIVIGTVEISNTSGIFVDATTNYIPYFTIQPTYTDQIETIEQNSQGKTVSTDILGIRFSNIQVPNEQEIGKKVIGYYIVRNEREDKDKSILDSAILLPTIKSNNNKYISQGLLNPAVPVSRQQADVKGLLHLEHKFKNKEYNNYDEIIHQGNFKPIITLLNNGIARGLLNYNDVYPGTSYNPEIHNNNNDDAEVADGSTDSKGLDGWNLNIYGRVTHVDFEIENDFILEKNDDIKEHFYLEALESKSINDNANDVYNITSDNKIGIIQTTSTGTTKLPSLVTDTNNYPYVLLKKNNDAAYVNFRNIPYYKESKNPHYFVNQITPSVANIYNGDTYISPLTYNNTVFNENRVAFRSGKNHAWKYVVGAVLIAAAIVVSVLTFGTGTVAATVGVTAAISALFTTVGAGVLLISSGIKGSNMNKAYNEEWNKGLRDTVSDTPIGSLYGTNANPSAYYNPMTPSQHNILHATSTGTYDGPSDDTIQWVGDCISDFWLESTINTHLRNRLKGDFPCFMTSPLPFQQGNTSPAYLWHVGTGANQRRWRDQGIQRLPFNIHENYLTRKLTTFDAQRNGGKVYLGIALGEYYNVFEPYHAINKQKAFYHLPIEYNCCSDCKENFPQRWRWSLQSFQEELSDNYRAFLPNNYKDLQDGSGEINNLIVLNNNLYIHTNEGFYQQPRNYQERVTDQIVSFIGSGSYGELPEIKIISDSIGMSAGLQHKQASILTPQYYWFYNVKDSKIFRFSNSSGLELISHKGLNSYFKENSQFEIENRYINEQNTFYPYKDNPSNPLGVGIIMGYDTRHERVLITKKDFKPFDEDLPFIAYQNSNDMYMINNFQNLINEQAEDGWVFLYFSGGTLVFSRTVITDTFAVGYENGTGTVSIPTQTLEVEFLSLRPDDISVPISNLIKKDKSFTLSFSLKANEGRGAWISWHSYLPYIYLQTADKFYSIQGNNFSGENGVTFDYNNIFKHNSQISNVGQKYHRFYSINNVYIIDYIFNKNSVIPFITQNIEWETFCREYTAASDFKDYIEKNLITFTNAIVYNDRQCSGLLSLRIKDTEGVDEDYLIEQTVNNDIGEIIIDYNETLWSMNDLRDYVVDNQVPIWLSDADSTENEYFIDKILNPASTSFSKDWTQLENFRDKYLGIRFIFNNFAQNSKSSVKMFFRFSKHNKQITER